MEGSSLWVPNSVERERPVARIISPPAYRPDLEAYGLRLVEGEIEAIEPCPDPDPRLFASERYQVDARLWEGQFDDRGRLRESRVTGRMGRDELTERYTRLRETLNIRESDDWFALGTYGGAGRNAGLDSNYVPLIPGPATRQQYWADYWASSAKCFEASTHSGIARRACNAMVQFPLGRGVRWQIKDDRARTAWEQFWKVNRMRRRFRAIAYDLAVFGEQMLRYFPIRAGQPGYLTVRQLDPATIYEIVTDQEDLETVFFYHQQFQTRMELYSPPRSNRAPEGPTQPGVTRYIIRQIDASEIDHWRNHTVAGEARGRSDLFPALGDLKRIRDLLTAKVVQADVGNRVMAVLTAKGTAADISRVLNSIFPGGQPPEPGTIVGINEANSLDPFQYSSGREVRSDFTYDELIDSICAGLEIGRPYLNLAPAQGSGTTQAGSLTTVEPSVQAFQERRDLLDELLHQMFDRVMSAAGINGEVDREFVFPSIVQEDRSQKLDDLETAEADNWISKRTAATAAAAEFDFTDYDYDDEQRAIIEEFRDAQETDGEEDDPSGVLGPDGKPLKRSKPAQGGKIRRPMLKATSRQVPKLDPTKAQPDDDEPMGVVFGPDGQPVQQPAGPGAGKNPAAASNAIRAQAPDSKVRESVRREPDDPEFAALASELERQTARNLKRLLDDIAA